MGTDDRQAPLADALRYMQSGTMIVAPMLGLGALGYWLDGLWGTKPWLMLAGLLIGMVGGFVNFFRFVLKPPDDAPPRGGGTPTGGGARPPAGPPR